MLKKAFILLMPFTILFAACGSDFTDDPDDNGKENPVAKEYVVGLDLLFQTEMTIREYSATRSGSLTLISDSEKFDSRLNKGRMHLIIGIFDASKISLSSLPVKTLEFNRSINESEYDFSTDITLPAGNYVAKVWCDFLDEGNENPFYTLFSFSQIMLTRHEGNTGFQDCYSGSTSFKVNEAESANGMLIAVSMSRPVGKYQIISEDFEEILNKEGIPRDEITSLVLYTGFYPDTYSIINDRLTDSLSGESYKMKPSGEISGLIASDYMLMNAGGSSATAQIGLYDKSGTFIANSEVLFIPLERDFLTIIRGKLLYSSSDDGGFGLNPDFDGDFNIIM